jgi:hypothetical protein
MAVGAGAVEIDLVRPGRHAVLREQAGRLGVVQVGVVAPAALRAAGEPLERGARPGDRPTALPEGEALAASRSGGGAPCRAAADRTRPSRGRRPRHAPLSVVARGRRDPGSPPVPSGTASPEGHDDPRSGRTRPQAPTRSVSRVCAIRRRDPVVDVAGQNDGHVIAASLPAKSVSMGGVCSPVDTSTDRWPCVASPRSVLPDRQRQSRDEGASRHSGGGLEHHPHRPLQSARAL